MTVLCPNCYELIDCGKHPKLRSGQARRALCMGENWVMRPGDNTWGFEELAEPTKDESRFVRFPSRAQRRRR